MNSYLTIALNKRKTFRIYCADTTEICENARRVHDLYPTSLAAFGRLLSGACLIAAMLKNEGEYVVVEINGKGPIGTCLAVARENGVCKGFCGNNEIYLRNEKTNKLDVSKAVGTDGFLKVSKCGLDNNFTGQVKLISGEIGEDLAYYFKQSEQTSSIVSLGVFVDKDYSCAAAGALIVQLLPNHTEEDICFLEDVLKIMQPISSLISQGLKPEDIIEKYFGEVEILNRKNLTFECDCSKENFMSKLATLDIKDLKELAMDEKINLKCEYCNTNYEITRQDLNGIINYVQNKRNSS